MSEPEGLGNGLHHRDTSLLFLDLRRRLEDGLANGLIDGLRFRDVNLYVRQSTTSATVLVTGTVWVLYSTYTGRICVVGTCSTTTRVTGTVRVLYSVLYCVCISVVGTCSTTTRVTGIVCVLYSVLYCVCIWRGRHLLDDHSRHRDRCVLYSVLYCVRICVVGTCSVTIRVTGTVRVRYSVLYRVLHLRGRNLYALCVVDRLVDNFVSGHHNGAS